MSFDINWVIKFGPAVSAVIVAIVYWGYRTYKDKSNSLEDIFIVGISGSSFPSGFLFIYGALIDASVVAKLSEAPVYIALGGFAMLYIAGKTLKEKISA